MIKLGWAACSIVLLASCGEAPGEPDPPAEPGAIWTCEDDCAFLCERGRSDCNGDLGTNGDGCEVPAFGCAPVEDIDLLFLIDDSNSTLEHKVNLSREYARMFSAFASGDLDGDGVADFPAPRSVRVGVVTSDMGAGGFSVETCEPSEFGRDGLLQNQTFPARSECDGSFPKIFDFVVGETDPLVAARHAECVTFGVGMAGCGFEQPLEAILKALTPSESELRFHLDSRGHGADANGEFLRDDSLLVIVTQQDEDDSSSEVPDLYNRESARYTSDLNLRCHVGRDALHPISRYVDGLLALRPDPDLLVYANVVGVPRGAVDGADVDYEALLAHPKMQARIDEDMLTRLIPSCNHPGSGLAFPPVRLVQLAQALEMRGAHTTTQTLCQSDQAAVIDAVLEKIATVLRARSAE